MVIKLSSAFKASGGKYSEQLNKISLFFQRLTGGEIADRFSNRRLAKVWLTYGTIAQKK